LRFDLVARGPLGFDAASHAIHSAFSPVYDVVDVHLALAATPEFSRQFPRFPVKSRWLAKVVIATLFSFV
jgi:hypothetical protein